MFFYDYLFIYLSIEKGDVVSVFPSNTGSWSLHTTRSWDFIGHEEGTEGSQNYKMPFRAKHGEDVIVGMLDSGWIFISYFFLMCMI